MRNNVTSLSWAEVVELCLILLQRFHGFQHFLVYGGKRGSMVDNLLDLKSLQPATFCLCEVAIFSLSICIWKKRIKCNS